MWKWLIGSPAPYESLDELAALALEKPNGWVKISNSQLSSSLAYQILHQTMPTNRLPNGNRIHHERWVEIKNRSFSIRFETDQYNRVVSKVRIGVLLPYYK